MGRCCAQTRLEAVERAVRGAVQRNKEEDRADFDAARRRGDVPPPPKPPLPPSRTKWTRRVPDPY